MTKKELLKRIEEIEDVLIDPKSDTKYIGSEIDLKASIEDINDVNRRIDINNNFCLDLLDYLNLDCKKEKIIKTDWLGRDKIVEKFIFSKKIKKSKK